MAAVTATFFSISNHGAPAVELEDVSNIDLEMTREGTEPLLTIRRERRAKHHKVGTKTYKVTLTSMVGVNEEVDWNRLFEEGRIFTLTYERAETSRRYQCDKCIIVSVSTGNDAEGTYEAEIEINFLAHDEVSR